MEEKRGVTWKRRVTWRGGAEGGEIGGEVGVTLTWRDMGDGLTWLTWRGGEEGLTWRREGLTWRRRGRDNGGERGVDTTWGE